MTTAVFDPSSIEDASYATIAVEGGATYDTLTDWKLIMTGMEVGDLVTRKYEVSVPGRDGTLDLSDALGGIYYDNRHIAMSFVCHNYTTEQFHALASTIRNAIKGKVCRITPSSDLGFFWRGRPDVEVVWPALEHTELTISLVAEPFKYNVVSSYDPWLWDSFSFVTGVVTDDTDITLDDETKTVVLPSDPARGKPTLWLNTGSARARLSTDQIWHVLKAGANVFPEIRMSADTAQTLLLNGTGSVGVEYRTGSL